VTAADVSNVWIRRYHPAPDSDVRLICFPHAGGSASYFHPVSARFAPTVDVISLQYPGRQDRRHEPCVADIETLADQLADELRTLPAKQTVLFGHSMGAVLAFEVARRLEDAGAWSPSSVVASGRRSPSSWREETVHRLGDDGVIAEIKALNGTSAALFDDDEILRMAMPSIRNDYRAVEVYRSAPDRTIACPIVVLVGDVDPKTTVAEARDWQRHTTGGCRVRVLPGGHFFLVQQHQAVYAELSAELGI
jgi:surfactin synthase thioesterase subunit